MRTVLRFCICVFVFAARGAAQRGDERATPGDQFLGRWSETWKGGGGMSGLSWSLKRGKTVRRAGSFDAFTRATCISSWDRCGQAPRDGSA